VVAAPSQSVAQTINLGTGQYGIFEASNGTNSGATFTVSGASAVKGNVLLGAHTTLSESGASTISGSTTTNVAGASVTLPAANKVTNYASGLTINTLNPLSIAGSAGVNVFNITGSLTLSSGTLTINGAANETFVFKVSNGVSFLNASRMVLNGVDASQVVFIVAGGNVTVSGASSAAGTFVGQNGNMSVSGASLVHGALVSAKNISVTGASTVNADAFVAPSPLTTHAPEMPTVVTAALACVLLLGGAGIRRLRR
jgi:hypothetical protein